MSTSERKSSLRRSQNTDNYDHELSQRSEFFMGKPDEPSFIPWRIFLNHVDSYHGQHLVDFLSDQIYVSEESWKKQLEDNDELEETVESEENEEKDIVSERQPPENYQIIGTLTGRGKACLKDVKLVIKDPNDREAFLSELMKCGIIIYDITLNPSQVEEGLWALKAIQRELEERQEADPKAFKRSDEVRYFILISTVMTWALTKPLSPEEPDLPFTEADYRKRKPHPNFKEHCQFEKDLVIVKKNPILSSKLKTLVISCGITYGEEEGPLHYLFRMAWKNATSLPIIGEGSNVVPLLHVSDLVTIVHTVLKNWPRFRYILAVEQEAIPQRIIVKKISRALATGNVKTISKEEALTLPEITEHFRDMLTVNLNMDPVYILDNMKWHYETPFRDNVDKVVEEFRRARNVRAMKVIVFGPPGSGKTKVARYLAEHYGLHYIHVKSLIADTIRQLSNKIEALTRGNKDEVNEREDNAVDFEEDEEEDDESPSLEELKEYLSEIRKSLEKNGGRLDDEALNKIFLKRLKSKECQNQGYVMDGYPKTLSQAKGLFSGDILAQDEESEDEEDEIPATSSVTSSIMPELVIALEASDEFLRERVINQPEREIQNTHYTEEHMMRRLREYRERNSDEGTPLRFFDEIEVHPLIIPIENDVCPDMFPTISQCLDKLGKPRNYGLTSEEAADAEARAAENARAAEEEKRLQKEAEFLECKRQREEKMMEWTNLMESLREEEDERLCTLGEPLRHYLARYIFPTLTRGLIEVAKLRPDDPIDYLAEYLFKENPEGKMFEPDHTQALNILLDKIEKFKNDIFRPDDLDDNVAAFWKSDLRTHESPRVTTVEGTVESTCFNQALGKRSPTSERAEMFERMDALSDDTAESQDA